MQHRVTFLAFLFFAFVRGTAFATDARVILSCTSTTVVQEQLDLGDNENGWKESIKCAEPTSWLDLSVGIDLLALQLTGRREVVSLGAAPSLGLLWAFRPASWTATPFIVGAELDLAMTLISPELAEGSASHVEIWTVLAVNLLGWFGIGIGGRYGLAVRDGEDDFARLVLTGGIRVPI